MTAESEKADEKVSFKPGDRVITLMLPSHVQKYSYKKGTVVPAYTVGDLTAVRFDMDGEELNVRYDDLVLMEARVVPSAEPPQFKWGDKVLVPDLNRKVFAIVRSAMPRGYYEVSWPDGTIGNFARERLVHAPEPLASPTEPPVQPAPFRVGGRVRDVYCPDCFGTIKEILVHPQNGHVTFCFIAWDNGNHLWFKVEALRPLEPVPPTDPLVYALRNISDVLDGLRAVVAEYLAKAEGRE